MTITPLAIIMPMLSVYLIVRAIGHKRAGRQRWFIHYLFMAALMLCIFIYEIWIHLDALP